MTKKNLLVLILSLSSYSVHVFAQNNEVSLSVGGVFATDQTATTVVAVPCPLINPGCNILTSRLSSSPGVAFMGNFARRITAFGPASLYVEAPVVGGPGHDTTISFRSGTLLGDIVTGSSSSLFFTPSAPGQFLHSSPTS